MKTFTQILRQAKLKITFLSFNLLLLSFCVGTDYVKPPLPNTWTQISSYPGAPRCYSVSFVINGKAYILSGSNYSKDVWEFNPSNSNPWTKKRDFPFIPRRNAVAFSIGNKGYFGTGLDPVTNNRLRDFWEYDPNTDAWTQKANFGGTERFDAVGFSIGTLGYAGTGNALLNGNGWMANDFWEYNPSTNIWTKKADISCTGRMQAVGTATSTKGYIGTGCTQSTDPNTYLRDFWEYNPSINKWTQLADLPGKRIYAVGLSIRNKIYIGTGCPTYTTYTNDFWEYDPNLNNTWVPTAIFSSTSRAWPVGFGINGRGYVGTGFDGNYKQDFYAYTPNP